MSSLREGMPPGEAAEGPHGPWRMSGERGATRFRGRDWLRDLPREASPAGHATGGMKGVPDREGLSRVSRLYLAVQPCDATVWTGPLAWRKTRRERRGIPS